jgi:hypothetical protein
MNFPVVGIRSDTMSLVTACSPLVMLRKATNSVTLLTGSEQSRSSGFTVGISLRKTHQMGHANWETTQNPGDSRYKR